MIDIEKLNQSIAEEFDTDVNIIRPEANIRQTLNLDSMRVMSLVVLVRRQTGVMLPVRHLQQFTTFQTLYDYLNI